MRPVHIHAASYEADLISHSGFYEHGGRPPLALVLTIDVSGSMSSDNNLEHAKSAMLTGLLPRLKPTDQYGPAHSHPHHVALTDTRNRLAILAFDDRIEELQKLTCVSDIDLMTLQQRIQKLVPRGTPPSRCHGCPPPDPLPQAVPISTLRCNRRQRSSLRSQPLPIWRSASFFLRT